MMAPTPRRLALRNRAAASALACVLCACVLAARPADATTVIPLEDEALAGGADMVVRGVVIEVRTATYAIGPGVFTEAVVAVDERLDAPRVDGEALDGSTPDEVILRIPGGETSDRHVIVPGMPSFGVGDEVVVFLEALPDAFGDEAAPAFIPFGLEQGVWRETAHGWTRGEQDGLLPTVAAPDIRPLSLDALRALVRPEVAP